MPPHHYGRQIRSEASVARRLPDQARDRQKLPVARDTGIRLRQLAALDILLHEDLSVDLSNRRGAGGQVNDTLALSA